MPDYHGPAVVPRECIGGPRDGAIIWCRWNLVELYIAMKQPVKQVDSHNPTTPPRTGVYALENGRLLWKGVKAN